MTNDEIVICEEIESRLSNGELFNDVMNDVGWARSIDPTQIEELWNSYQGIT